MQKPEHVSRHISLVFGSTYLQSLVERIFRVNDDLADESIVEKHHGFLLQSAGGSEVHSLVLWTGAAAENSGKPVCGKCPPIGEDRTAWARDIDVGAIGLQELSRAMA